MTTTYRPCLSCDGAIYEILDGLCPVCLGSGRVDAKPGVRDALADRATFKLNTPEADVMRRDKPCKASDGPCIYCGREAAGFFLVPEPTERSTYSLVWRVLCREDWNEYKEVPYGFRLEA